MDSELKQKWIDALRSGDYEQGQSYLCRISSNGNKYCCLGVLAEIDNKFIDEEIQYNVDLASWTYKALEGKTECGSPFVATFSDKLTHHYGLDKLITDDVDDCTNIQIGRMLMRMNDNGVPFVDIADYIEANL